MLKRPTSFGRWANPALNRTAAGVAVPDLYGRVRRCRLLWRWAAARIISEQNESDGISTRELLDAVYHRAIGRVLFGVGGFGTNSRLLFTDFPRPLLDWGTRLPSLEAPVES